MKKIFLMFFVALVVFSQNSISVFASEMAEIQLLEEISLPDGLNFTVSDSCSEHHCFLQASANSLGDFAVYSRHMNFEDGIDYDFKKAYIDLYNSDGIFLQELSFFTTFDFVFSLESNCIKIYFSKSVLIYNFDTGELSCYAISEGVVRDSGLYSQLKNSKFSSGKWNYECKKGYNGYVKLTRTSNNEKEVLLELSGSGLLMQKVILPGSICGLILMIICIFIWKRKRIDRG